MDPRTSDGRRLPPRDGQADGGKHTEVRMRDRDPAAGIPTDVKGGAAGAARAQQRAPAGMHGSQGDLQPHNILQRRLLESNLYKPRSNRPTWIPKSEAQSNRLHHGKGENLRKSDEDEAVFVWCQCEGKEMKVKIDTSCQHSVISSACLDRLGLKEHFRSYKKEEENLSLPYNVRSIGQVEHLTVTLGHVSLDCTVAVIDDKERSFSLGLQALRSLKCVINLEKNHLEVGRSEREVVPFIVSHNASREENSSSDAP